MVTGSYVRAFSDASHVIFQGHLDDPGFRAIAIQRIKKIQGRFIEAEISGRLSILADFRGERVKLGYKSAYNQIFGGSTATAGWPFKDKQTEAIGGDAAPLFQEAEDG